jgi:hypothetical protein
VLPSAREGRWISSIAVTGEDSTTLTEAVYLTLILTA